MLVNTKITDSAISAHIVLPKVTVLRDTQLPLLQIRFKKNRCSGVWRIYHKNKWHKVGEWPRAKTREVRQSFNELLNRIESNQQANLSHGHFANLGQLLEWYLERKLEDRELSTQRRKDIKTAVTRHMIPRIGHADFSDLTHAYLDKNFIRPAQQELAKSSVAKLFRTLKAALYDASHLQMIDRNPLAEIKITNFGNYVSRPKGSALQPFMVYGLLERLEEEKPLVKMVFMLMLTLGTRIGETRRAKWSCFNLSNNPVWVIPATDTKNKKPHTIYLPSEVADLLREWKDYQVSRYYKGPYLFPDRKDKSPMESIEASQLFKHLSEGQWTSHDLRKCARICWAENGVDYMVAERMLNHELNKIAEAYLDTKVKTLHLEALQDHVQWLLKQNKNCFSLNLSTVSKSEECNSKAA